MDLCLMAHDRIANPASHDVLRWFGELHDPLRRYLVCAGADPADADEVVQETFLKLHLQFQKNAEPANVRAWVFAVARNCLKDARKSAHSRRTVVLDDAMQHHTSFVDPGGNPEHSALRDEQSLRLGKAVGKLPERERECILLRSSGLRYREIAEILGIETNRIGGLMLRAVTHLRKELA